MVWGALIGAGASLLGGLFGSGSKKQQTQTTTTSHVDYRRMVREAESAGFNPLTALRNGGAAGFSVSTSNSATPATPLSARVADGVSGGVQTFLANFDPFKDQQREAEFKLVEAQLANLQADTALKKVRFGDVPTYSGDNQKRTMGANVKSGQKFKSVADAVDPKLGTLPAETKTPERTNPYPTWSNFEINPWQPDASHWEDHLGENFVSSGLGTLLQTAQDLVWNGYRYVRAVKGGFTGENGSTTGAVLSDLVKKGIKDSNKPHPSEGRSFSEIWEAGFSRNRKLSLSSPKKQKQ